ncbi:hypothetical protein [Shewanella sp. T24-MNA-CIBAN-0130]|uniref:hypothetical protein n=1 Tax=Shewanella sp. T24-MNA-CIBAN-0130 TaxID=3140470 RepID=UPI0033254A6E
MKSEITYFKINKFGFYNKKSLTEVPLFGGYEHFIQLFSNWLKKQENLGSTSTKGPDNSGNNIYCSDFYHDESSGNFVITLWNEMSNVENKVLSLSRSQSIGNSTVKEDGDENSIIGLPSYFYFIPKKDLMLHVGLPQSSDNLRSIKQYISSYFKNLSKYKQTNSDGDTYYSDSEGEDKKCQFRLVWSKYTNQAEKKSLIDKAENISKIIQKVHITKYETDDRHLVRKGWEKLNNAFNELIPNFMSDDDDSKLFKDAINEASNRDFTISSPFKCDSHLIKKIINQYDQENENGSNNLIGFRTKGSSKTIWLSDSIIKTKIDLDIKSIDKKLPTATVVFIAISEKQEEILLPVYNEDEDTMKNAVNQ